MLFISATILLAIVLALSHNPHHRNWAFRLQIPLTAWITPLAMALSPHLLPSACHLSRYAPGVGLQHPRATSQPSPQTLNSLFLFHDYSRPHPHRLPPFPPRCLPLLYPPILRHLPPQHPHANQKRPQLQVASLAELPLPSCSWLYWCVFGSALADYGTFASTTTNRTFFPAGWTSIAPAPGFRNKPVTKPAVTVTIQSTQDPAMPPSGRLRLTGKSSPPRQADNARVAPATAPRSDPQTAPSQFTLETHEPMHPQLTSPVLSDSGIIQQDVSEHLPSLQSARLARCSRHAT